MRSKALKLLSAVMVLVLFAACTPAPTPAAPAPTQPPQVIIQTQIVQGTPQIIQVTAPPAPTMAPVDNVSLRTNFIFYGSHSIFFYGKQLGLYQKQNINVDIKQGNGSGNVVQLVANKDSTFGYVSAAAEITQVAKGAPVVAVATIDAAGTDAVLCNPDKGIKTIKDLEGKTILTTAGAGVNVFWPVVVQNAGLDASKIKLTNVADAALTPSYLQGLAPCMLGGIDDKPAQIEANGGKPPVEFLYADYGVSQPGYVIITHTDTVKNNPDLVKRFVLATLEATKAAQQNPDASVAAMANYLGQAQMDATAIPQARKVLDVTLSILISKNNTDKVLGWNTDKDFASALALFKQYEDLQTDLPSTAFYTNDFVPKTLP